MKSVVQVQYSSGSAGKQGFRFHQAFLEAGIDSRVITLFSDTRPDSKMKNLGNSYKWIAKWDTKLQKYLTRKVRKEMGLFSYPVLGSNIAKLPEVQSADAIYIHWVQQGFLSLRSFRQLARLKKPVIFVLHDMWSITGGCHYSFECEKYITGCNTCPMFTDPPKKDLSYKEFQKKKRLYSSVDNFYFVSPSRWLYDCAKKALLTKDKPVFHIPNFVDRSIYKAGDKASAKKMLNVAEDESVILFGAVSVESPYKGWEYLRKGLEFLHQQGNDRKITVMVVGGGYNERIAQAIPFPTRFLGYLKDDYSMALVYNAADVFVAPSLADNLPTTIFESQCCGTPVVAFNTGGIPDLIQHRVNGYLAKYKEAEDLANGIRFCLENKITGSIGKAFDRQEVLKKHFELFEYISSHKKGQ